VAPEFPYGHTYGLRRLSGSEVPLTRKETKARDALKAEPTRGERLQIMLTKTELWALDD
jgi:ParB family chromosome partitioning protein